MMSTSDCVLLHGDAFRGNILCLDAAVASATTRDDLPIEVSVRCPERPLLPTILFASVPGIDFSIEAPRIVRAVEDIILLRVPVDGLEDEYDYFIYRLGGEKGPSLKLLPPAPNATFFHDEDIGLLRRGKEHYTVAALLATSNSSVYDLYRFDSATDKWSIDAVSLVQPQISFPYKKKIPRSSDRLLFHLTSTVIPIGGEGGTMGWVDLWRGILLCDVLSEEPYLRGVPLPLPLDLLSRNNGLGTHLGCPKSLRSITYINKRGMDPYLKFVHLEANASQIPQDPSDDNDEEDWKMSDWKVTTWRNYRMTTTWQDWHQDWEVDAAQITISSKLNTKMLKRGLLSPGGAKPERACFKNVLVSFPALGIDDGVVYLQARVKFQDPKVFVLALDTRDNKLLGAVEFATERIRGAGVVYFPSNISKYIDPEDRVIPISEGDTNWEESDQYEGTEYLKFPFLTFPCFGKVSLNDTAIST